MKLRYRGGHKEKVLVRADPKGAKNKVREVEKDQLSQMLEGTMYLFPEPGAVVTVAPNIGGWLLGKHPKHLEEIPADPDETVSVPNVVVAIVPKDKPKDEKAEK